MSLAINLTGGGARGAYQVGVLRGLYEIIKEEKLFNVQPFRLWAGSSAGAINAAACAAGAHDPLETLKKVEKLWREITPNHVYRTDFPTLTKNGYRWIRDLTFGGWLNSHLARALLDTTPLWSTIKDNIDFNQIKSNVEKGWLDGVAINSYSHQDNRTISFLSSKDKMEWDRPRRASRSVEIAVEHVIASCSIPLLFPTVKINDEYFADGSFRSLSPLSPLIQMGAKKILTVGVRGPNEFSDSLYHKEPGVAKVAGVMLNALFFDTIDIDLERIQTVNEMIRSTRQNSLVTDRSDYSPIDCLVLRPSRDVSRMAAEKGKMFPRMLRFLLGGLGSHDECAELASYLLFVPEFTNDLIDLGYLDTLERRKEIAAWLKA